MTEHSGTQLFAISLHQVLLLLLFNYHYYYYYYHYVFTLIQSIHNVKLFRYL